MNILIVEDNASVRTVLSKILRMRFPDSEVIPAEVIPPPKEWARGADIILMDYLLGIPDQTGLDLAQKYRLSGITAPILFLSSHIHGFDDFIQSNVKNATWLKKPWRSSQLVKTIEYGYQYGFRAFRTFSKDDLERFADGYRSALPALSH